MRNISALLVLALIGSAAIRAQVPDPDARMKADILLIVAHPDDETAIGSYLARAVFDEGKRVAIIYCNHGTGGETTLGSNRRERLARSAR